MTHNRTHPLVSLLVAMFTALLFCALCFGADPADDAAAAIAKLRAQRDELAAQVDQLKARPPYTPPPATQPTTKPTTLPAVEAPAYPDALGVGVNLDANTDYAPDARWVDLTRGFRPPERLDGSALAALTPTGHAAERAIVTFNTIGRTPGTVYRLAWTGGRGATIAPTGSIRTVGQGAGYIDLAPPIGKDLQFVVTPDPADPITSWSMLDPNEDPAYTYTAAYRDAIKPFAVLRGMDWLQTNHNPLTRWTDRITASFGVQTPYRVGKRGDPRPKGCALEHVIRLAVETGKVLWLNCPDQLDDQGVRDFARQLLDQYPRDRVLIIEWSNEPWNGGFEQGQRLAAKAKAAGIWLPQQHAREHVRMANIFREVWGDQAPRLRFALNAQIASKDAWHAAECLKEIARAGPVSQYVTYLAVAPYRTLALEGRSGDDYVKALAAQSRGAMWEKFLAHQKLADNYGLRLACYECGYADEADPVNAKTIDALITGHPLMGDAIAAYWEFLTRHMGPGKFLACHFTLVDKRWGLMPQIDQPGAKYKSLTGIAAND